jgi:hypothetical protein
MSNTMPNISSHYTQAIMTAVPVPVGRAEPPLRSGVYVFSYQGRDIYVGQAKGSKGLRDRILSKHVSGDEGHALQRFFKDDFPDRDLRRAHIRKAVSVRWVEVPADEVGVVERALINRFAPECNRA